MALIVLTGTNGFIGNNLLDAILKQDMEILGRGRVTTKRFSGGEVKEVLDVLCCDLSESMVRPIAQRFLQSARVKFVAHDKLEAELRNLKEVPVAVVHNGACSSTTETNPEVFKTLNVEYSKMLWNYCSEFVVPFIYASSAATYGDGSLGFSDKKEDCSKFKPLNLYGKSKHDFDMWVLEQKNTPPTWFGLRYFNVFGPFESHKNNQASMVFHGYRQSTQTGKIKLFESNDSKYEDGEQKRDFVYVKDVVDVTLELIKLSLVKTNSTEKPANLEGNGCFLNVGRGEAVSWNVLMEAVFKALGMPSKIEYIPMPDNLMKQYQNFTEASLGTLRSVGVKHSFMSIEESVYEYVTRFLMRGM